MEGAWRAQRWPPPAAADAMVYSSEEAVGRRREAAEAEAQSLGSGAKSPPIPAAPTPAPAPE